MRLYHFLFLLMPLLALELTTNSCSKEDDGAETPANSCASVNCTAPKFCELGVCVCPVGYTGNNCAEERTPLQVRVTKVMVLEFPMVDQNGDNWDPDGNPDLSIGILGKDANAPLFSSNLIFDNASSPGTYEFPVDAILDDMSFEYGLYFIDIDIVNGEQVVTRIGGVNIVPYTAGQNFPEEVNFETKNQDGEVTSKATVSLNYIF